MKIRNPFRNSLAMIQASGRDGFKVSVANALVVIPAGVGHVLDSLFNTNNHNARSIRRGKYNQLAITPLHSGFFSRKLTTSWYRLAQKVGKRVHNVARIIPWATSPLGPVGRFVGAFFTVAEALLSLALAIPTAIVKAAFTFIGDLLDGAHFLFGKAFGGTRTPELKDEIDDRDLYKFVIDDRDLDRLMDRTITHVNFVSMVTGVLEVRTLEKMVEEGVDDIFEKLSDSTTRFVIFRNRSKEPVEKGHLTKSELSKRIQEIRTSQAQAQKPGRNLSGMAQPLLSKAEVSSREVVPTPADVHIIFTNDRAVWSIPLDRIDDAKKKVLEERKIIKSIDIRGENGTVLKPIDYFEIENV